MLKGIASLLLTTLLMGCTSVLDKKLYRASLASDVSGPSRVVLHNIKDSVSEAELAPTSFTKSMNTDSYSFTRDYISMPSDKYKAMFGISPESCDSRYRYYSSKNNREEVAVGRARRGCETRANKINKVLGGECNCRIIALGDVFFYEEVEYRDFRKTFPVMIQITEGDEIVTIKGVAKVKDTRTVGDFELFNDAGHQVCTGSYDMASGPRGTVSVYCYEGAYAPCVSIVVRSPE